MMPLRKLSITSREWTLNMASGKNSATYQFAVRRLARDQIWQKMSERLPFPRIDRIDRNEEKWATSLI
jgi:hypothetical protein